MTLAKKCCVLILVATIAAALFRVPGLDIRPLHTDEAVHAAKFADLLENGNYRYDPHEYHGPTLNYLTLIPALLSGAGNLSQTNEYTLRIVTVFFGVALVLMLLLIGRGLGFWAAVFAAVFTALSPVMVFYSRYYIQEMLLVCFTFGFLACGYRLICEKRMRWALAAGVFLGLANATKETCIIAYGSIVAALAGVLIIDWARGRSPRQSIRPFMGRQLVALIAAAAVVSVLFFSSFFSNPRGIVDAFATYGTYFNRAGQNPIHNHPWNYYLGLIGWYRFADGAVFTELAIIIPAAIGLVVSVLGRGAGAHDKGLRRFIAFYTVLMTAMYSLIPYKTPWCLLGFWHGMILLAGVGVEYVLGLRRRWIARTALGLVVIGCVHLLWQGYAQSYGIGEEGGGRRYIADSRNPWVYSHASLNVLTIADWVEKIASAQPEEHEMYLQVITPGGDCWPLPWYLRKFENAAYTTMVFREGPSAPLIIASPEVSEALMKKLYVYPPPGQREAYLKLFDVEFRPQVRLQGYVSNSAWERYYYSDSASDVQDVINSDRENREDEQQQQDEDPGEGSEARRPGRDGGAE